MTTKEKMSQWEYQSYGGTRCPFCKGLDPVAIGKLREAEDGRVYKAMRCIECGERWREVWILKGYQA